MRNRLLAKRVVEAAKRESLRLVTAESCTGGLVSALLTAVPGASASVWGSFVVYTVEAKKALLGVEVEPYGAVSRETALAMASAARERASADIALAITGLAGPSGDGSGQAVGTVWLGLADARGGLTAELHHFKGSRDRIRCLAAKKGLKMMDKLLNFGETA
jgi:PncC family amidohydrolase